MALSLFIEFDELDIQLTKIEGCPGDYDTPPEADWAEVKSIHWQGQDITQFILANYDEDILVEEYLEHKRITAEEL